MDKILFKKFKHKKFRNQQEKIIKNVLNGKDTCAVMYTGSGKSLCYQLPPVYTKKVGLIITPLISLMNDQKNKLNDLNIPSVCLNGTVKFKHNLKQDIINNKYRLVYTTPEYITTCPDLVEDLYNKDLLTLLEIVIKS